MVTEFSTKPGPIALFGSGETAPGGQKIFDFLLKLGPPAPLISILETPAGFEPNAGQVAQDVGDFIQHHLRNHKPRLQQIPARRRGTAFSPDDPHLTRPLLHSDVVFMGPGSPSYAVRQLEDSLAWQYVLARHRLGASLVFSSATTVAVSSSSLPVYEIYKVGEELHWKPGLDFFSHYGLNLIFIPHWNNQDGGQKLDTSRCYMGEARFNQLLELLPEDQIVIGIDEHTGLVIDFQSACMHVIGQSQVTILEGGGQRTIPAGTQLELTQLGSFELCDPLAGITKTSWQDALEVQKELEAEHIPSQRVEELAEKRQAARTAQDWEAADLLRTELENLGWTVQDTEDGYQLQKLVPGQE